VTDTPIRQDSAGYAYFHAGDDEGEVRHREGARDLSNERLHPKLHDPDYLILRARRKLFSRFVQELPDRKLSVLDVGGRLQPLRPLLGDRVGSYVAIDPVMEGMLDVVAVGEEIPFQDESFDLVICTQVMTYVSEPPRVIGEIHRVLKKGGSLFLSVPALLPRYHDMRWLFMPEGILFLLVSFVDPTILPEGKSIAGLFRSINQFLETYVHSWRLKSLIAHTVYPVLNLTGLLLDRLSRGRTEFSANYSCTARKAS